MLRRMFVVILLFVIGSLCSLEVKISNRSIEEKYTDNGIILTQEGSYYSNIENEPFIPVISKFFKLPKGQKIVSVQVKQSSSKTRELSQLLLPQQKQVIMSDGHATSHDLSNFSYDNKHYPDKLLFNYGSGISGNENIGYVALYSATYDSALNKLNIPNSFTLNIELEADYSQSYLPNSLLTDKVNNLIFGYSNNSNDRPVNDGQFLLIYPQEFEVAYQPLVSFRKTQGLEVYTATVEDILLNSIGNDDQEKIRNYIIEQYEDNDIDYVTLGADVESIPERRFWAFDCGYGIEDENNIPSDMYYSCLNGNWNANNNDLYGEDDDEPDYFPEVILARIPALTSADVTAMINKVIEYEKGNHEDYSVGLGLSADLWETSNSVYAQQYIEEQYFNDFIDNTILYDEDNNEANAQFYWNNNPNIIQHTGHCFHSVIALEDGSINTAFVNNMQNDWSGVFYSIGCWASALEFDSIAEKLLRVENHGVTAFVGNSRYGWGAPGADAFGFSEFFQKEFFKQLFVNEETNVAMLNNLQKIPFIPYMSGNSVYKWCAYELNTIGDSGYNLFIDEVKDFDVEIHNEGDNYFVHVSDDDVPVWNVSVKVNNTIYMNDYYGNLEFMAEPGSTIELYRYGYKYQQFELTTDNTTGFTALSYTYDPEGSLVIDNVMYQLINSANEELNWQLMFSYNTSNEVMIASGTLAANSTSEELTAMADMNEPLELHFKLVDADNSEILDQRTFYRSSPSLNMEIASVDCDSYPLVRNQTHVVTLNLKYVNEVSRFGDYSLNFTSEDFEVSPSEIGIVYNITDDIVLQVTPINPTANYGTIDIEVGLNEVVYQLADHIDLTLAIDENSFMEDFEEEVPWISGMAWQRTDSESQTGDYSLTCKPTAYGEYQLDLPVVTYTEDLALSFNYKYKMPMYGSDGFSLYLVHGGTEERVLFLGSGGALDESNLTRDNYIFSDWANYTLNLNDNVLDRPELGEEVILRFVFSYSEDGDVDNDYASNEDLGVFLDNMEYMFIQNTPNADNQVESVESILNIYPNPINNGKFSARINDKIGTEYQLNIYNIKGQRVKSITGKINSADSKEVQFNVRDNNSLNLSSGVYFVKYISVDTSDIKKILILK